MEQKHQPYYHCNRTTGNTTIHDLFEEGCSRQMCWDEENRLAGFSDCHNAGFYQYDANGERTYKLTWAGSSSNRSGDRSIYYTPDEATLYASPYLVVTPQGYTKHYYAEAERITSQLGKGQFADVGTPVVSDSLVQVKLQAVTNGVDHPATLTVPASSRFSYLDTLTNQQNATSTLYFYHPDHLGSSSWITTTNGTVKQHLHYLPWGETYVDQKSNRFDGVRYTFSAKEKDTETGYSYFGARYYTSDLSVWLSVDPMSDKYPSLSPYVYCANNPVKLVDPNGEDVVILNAPQGAGGYGHMAAIIQDKQGNWYYMTMGADENGNGNLSQVLSSGVRGGMTLESCGTKDMKEAIEFAKKDVNNSEYTQELVLRTSSKMDDKIYQSALDKQNNVNSEKEEYKALTNSCADAVKDVLEKGLEIELPSKIDPRPNSYFNKLLKKKNEIQSNINVLIDGEKSGTKSKYP